MNIDKAIIGANRYITNENILTSSYGYEGDIVYLLSNTNDKKIKAIYTKINSEWKKIETGGGSAQIDETVLEQIENNTTDIKNNTEEIKSNKSDITLLNKNINTLNTNLNNEVNDRKSTNNTLNTNLNNEVIQRKNDVNTINAKLNSVDTELKDICVGTDNTIYSTAGEAVRSQFNKLKEENENLVDMVDKSTTDTEVVNSRVSKLLEEMSSDVTSDITPELKDIRIGSDGTIYDCAGDAVRAIGNEINTVKDELEKYVDAKAIDGLLYENNMLYLLSAGEIASEPVEITGGSGGSTSVVKLTNLNGTTVLSSAVNESVILKFNFTSIEDDIPTGNGSCRITVNGVTKTTFNISQGINSFDVKEYLAIGTNSVKVTCTDVYGNYRTITYSITVIEISIESVFDDTITYNSNITFKYTPYGLIEKTIHFIIDNSEVDTIVVSSSGKQSTKIFNSMSHGVHRLDVYMTATLDGNEIESNHLIFDIMCIEDGETEPFIASPLTTTTISQGEQLSIPYTVYDPTSLSCNINLNIYTLESDSKEIYSTQSITVDRSRKTWNTRQFPIGTVYFEIEYPSKSISKIHTITVTEAKINVEPVTNDLELSLSSTGRSNGESNPSVWKDGNVTTAFENMNWDSTGWVKDENGDTVLRLNGDAKATISFKPFDKDLRIYGKTFEIEFTIRDVNNRDAVVINCMNGGIGIYATADRAVLQSEQSSIECRFKDEEKVRIAFVIESRNEYRMMSIYLNGILSGTKQYASNDNFQQVNPVNIIIGSPYCAIDIYSIRSYSTALTPMDITKNYIADIQDVVEKVNVYNKNDIYNDYNALSYEKIKPKIPVMTIIGTLPTSKGNKQDVTIVFEDPNNPDLNFTDSCKIDIQGTSSQYYPRKNFKLKFPQKHQHAPDMMSTNVYTMKVDYAESTGTHNTQNANLIGTLYDEKIPPQNDDPQIRTTIYGFPCVIFHQSDELSEPVFYGKANFNYDKNSENVFGFTEDYDVECWEFLNNTSDVCNFKAPLPEVWTDDFEARYPEECTDTTRLSEMLYWVYSTKDDLTKFRNEFESHFDLHYVLIYYIYTFVMLMVDQRAKNMMFTYWASTGKWYPYFYDNDTSIAINNEGQLVFDYYHEDIDQYNGANVYNGKDSVLWNNFRVAYADEIASTYRSLRSSGKITYDKLCNYFITNGSDKWSESIYNEDSEFKYVAPLKEDGDASNLYQIRGDGKQHFKYFMKNRLNYCDSKWYAQDYADDYVYFRIYTPVDTDGDPRTDLVVPACANITVTPFSNMYAGVRYKANGTLQQQRVEKNVPVTFIAPNEVFNDTETSVYGASNISSLGDLSPLYAGSINVSKAVRLVELIVGSTVDGYDNPNLVDISVGTNKLLKKIDIRNCSGLTESLNLSGCPNIEEIYAEGSKITGIDLVSGGHVKIIHLPNTLKNLTLKNQIYINDFSAEGYNELKTLCIENCVNIDEKAILTGATNIERARLVGVNWSIDDVSFLRSLYNIAGIDETGANTDLINISGKCHIKELTGAEMGEINEKFPYLEITFDTLTSNLIFMSEDGTTEYGRQTILNGGDGSEPVNDGLFSTPTKSSTAQYTFTYDGWSLKIGAGKSDNALKAVYADRQVYAHFSATIRYYTVTFKNGTTTLQTVTVPYGGTAEYTGDTPVKSDVDEPDDYPFIGWNPSPTNITGNTTCVAQFASPYELKEITDDWDTIIENINNGTYKTKYNIGNYKPLDLGSEGIINMQIVAKDSDILADDNGNAATSWVGIELLTTSKRFNPSLVTNYDYSQEKESWSIVFDGSTSKQYRTNTVYCKDTIAKATWNITAKMDGSINIKYQTTNANTSNNTLTLIVNDEYICTDIANTNLQIYSMDISEGDKITLVAEYNLFSSNGYSATIIFATEENMSDLITIEMQAENAPYRLIIDYDDCTGTIGGWEKSELRTYCNNTLYSLIPENVRSCIKNVQKSYSGHDTNGNIIESICDDNVWIPSSREIVGVIETSGPKYNIVFYDNTTRKKKKYNSNSEYNWWLRSKYSTDPKYYSAIQSDGNYIGTASYSTNNYIAIGFCI